MARHRSVDTQYRSHRRKVYQWRVGRPVAALVGVSASCMDAVVGMTVGFVGGAGDDFACAGRE